VGWLNLPTLPDTEYFKPTHTISWKAVKANKSCDKVSLNTLILNIVNV